MKFLKRLLKILLVVVVVLHTPTTLPQGVIHRTMEVTDLKSAEVPDSRFELPAGYQERQLPAMAGGQPRGGD